LGLLELKILLVVILAVPMVLLGIKLTSSLADAALMGKKKTGKRKKAKDDDD